MGFMAGFGEGFSNAFETRQKLDAAAEQDTFQVAYTNYMKNKTQYDADKKKDTEAKTQAKAIVAGLPNVTPDAWTYAYKLIREGGYTADQVEQKLTTTKFSKIPTAEPIAPATAPLDTQMADSGLGEVDKPVDATAANDPTTTPNATPNNSGLLGDFTNGIQNKIAEIGNPEKARQNAADAANGRVSGLVGQEDFNNANAGYKPEEITPTVTAEPMAASPLAEFGLDKGPLTAGDLSRTDSEAAINLKSADPDLKAKAMRYLAIRPDIEASIIKNDPKSTVEDLQFSKDLGTLIGGSEKARIELAGKKADVQSLQDSAKKMGDLLQTNGSLNTWGAKGLSGAEQLKNNVVSMLDIGSKLISQNSDLDVNSINDQVNQWADANIPGWRETGTAEREFASQLLKFQYVYSRSALGQTGNSQSNTDIANVKDIILNSNDPTEAIDHLKSIVSTSASDFNHQSEALLKGSWELQEAMRLQKERYGGVSTLEMSIGTITPDQLAWTTSKTPDNISANPTKNDGTITQDTAAPEAKPQGEGVPGEVANEAQRIALEQELAGKPHPPIKIGQKYIKYENGYDIQ